MNRAGAPDPLYVKARRVLLDALEALGPQRASVVLVGAQAIYLHVGDADLGVAPYTTDGDVILDPTRLQERPLLADAMRGGGFLLGEQPGRWSKDGVPVDLMVPEALAGSGRRGARLGVHGDRVARRARGLEGALVDVCERTLTALDPEDARRLPVRVAGAAALLVSKLVKVSERVGDRARDKDALDIFRLLRGTSVAELQRGLNLLQRDARAQETTDEAQRQLRELFARAAAPGNDMLARALGAIEDEATLRVSCAALSEDLLAALSRAAGEDGRRTP
jgi:hypothetical protein